MAILNYKSRCALDSKNKSLEMAPGSDSITKSSAERMRNEIQEKMFPNSEFQNLSLNEKNGSSSSGDEGDRSSSEDEKCPHECRENEESFCDLLTEECVVESLSDSTDDQVLIKTKIPYFSYSRN